MEREVITLSQQDVDQLRAMSAEDAARPTALWVRSKIQSGRIWPKSSD